jgi:hypothetical protein
MLLSGFVFGFVALLLTAVALNNTTTATPPPSARAEVDTNMTTGIERAKGKFGTFMSGNELSDGSTLVTSKDALASNTYGVVCEGEVFTKAYPVASGKSTIFAADAEHLASCDGVVQLSDGTNSVRATVMGVSGGLLLLTVPLELDAFASSNTTKATHEVLPSGDAFSIQGEYRGSRNILIDAAGNFVGITSSSKRALLLGQEIQFDKN